MGISIAGFEEMKELIRDIHENAVNHGFWESPSTAEKLVLVHSELSEFIEELRKHEPNQEHLAEELADACIRIFDMAHGLGLDIVKAIVEKHEFNKARPYLHGKRF